MWPSPLLRFFLHVWGLCLVQSLPIFDDPDESFLANKIVPFFDSTQYLGQRYRRFALDNSALPTVAPELPSQASHQKKKKANKSNKKSDVTEDEAVSRFQKLYSGKTKKLKKPLKGKKLNALGLRGSHSPKRLRQHMQHKKKVKEYLQKRVWEQIQQRNPPVLPPPPPGLTS